MQSYAFWIIVTTGMDLTFKSKNIVVQHTESTSGVLGMWRVQVCFIVLPLTSVAWSPSHKGCWRIQWSSKSRRSEAAGYRNGWTAASWNISTASPRSLVCPAHATNTAIHRERKSIKRKVILDFENEMLTSRNPHKPVGSCIFAWRAWTGRENQAGRTGNRWAHGRLATPRWQFGTWCSCPSCSPRRISGRAGRGFLAALHLRTPPPDRQSSRCLLCRSPPWWMTAGLERRLENRNPMVVVTGVTLRQDVWLKSLQLQVDS